MFEYLQQALAPLQSASGSISGILGGQSPTPQVPQIPTVSAMPRMPFISDAVDAGRNVLRSALQRSGRASTILTSRRKRQSSQSAPASMFDTYSKPTL